MSARLAAAGAVFTAAYYTLFALGLPQWTADTALVLPAGMAALMLVRRAGREAGRAAWFFRLLALAAATWALGTALWAAAEYMGHSPYATVRELRGFPVVFDALFLGFLLPVLAALALRAHGRAARPGPLAIVDGVLLTSAIAFVFLRLSLLPLLGRPHNWLALQGALWFVVAVWSTLAWRAQDQPRWRRAYGALALFALTYFSLATIAQGLGRVLTPGGPTDLAWVLPFLILMAVADETEAVRRRPLDWTPSLVLACGAGPLVLDRAGAVLLPAAGLDFPETPWLLLAATAWLAAGCAVRLWVEGAVRAAATRKDLSRAEEERRAARLAELARVAGPYVVRLQAAVEEVWSRTRLAAAAAGEQAGRAIEQAGRAREVVARLARALRPPAGRQEEIELAPFVESCVHQALEDGPALNVSLEGLGALPTVRGCREALAGCFVQLVRNAAQASPGGALRITGAVDEGAVVLRFADDGPGIPGDRRHRVFEPFFTTRRVGEGYGLGLTEAHFVAREHGGAVLLETPAAGASVAVRLPASWASSRAPAAHDWPLPVSVVAAAAVALVLVVLPSTAQRMAWSVAWQIGAAALAGAALTWTAARHTGRTRTFWAALAAGPTLWGATRLLRAIEGGLEGLDRGGVWHYGTFALAELAVVVALLVRPDRPRPPHHGGPWLLGVAATFCLCTFVYAHLVLLPSPFALWDGALRQQTAAWRGALRLGLAGWALGLALRAGTPYWRALFAKLALVLTAWAAGQGVAGLMRARAGYQGGALSDLGWIAPLLVLAGLALAEGLRAPRRETLPVLAAEAPPLWSAAALASLAVLPAFDALVGPSAHPDLDLFRRGMTWTTVGVMGALLAAREYLAHREAPFRRRRPSSAAGSGMDPDRLLRVVSTAVYEMAGHLSGITALARLVLTQSDASGRIRGDSERIQARADMAARIARNLIALLQDGPASAELSSVNRLVEEVAQARAADLAHEGIAITRALDPQLPPVWWPHGAAVRQALLCCLDAAAVALRSQGRRGTVELTTAQQGDELVVRVHGDGQGLPRSVLAPLGSGRHDSSQDPDLGLTLAREILAQCGGTLAGRYRAEGGAELVLRLPMSAVPRGTDAPWPSAGAGRPN